MKTVRKLVLKMIIVEIWVVKRKISGVKSYYYDLLD